MTGYGLIILALVSAGIVGKITIFYMAAEFILILIGSVLCVWDEIKDKKQNRSE